LESLGLSQQAHSSVSFFILAPFALLILKAFSFIPNSSHFVLEAIFVYHFSFFLLHLIFSFAIPNIIYFCSVPQFIISLFFLAILSFYLEPISFEAIIVSSFLIFVFVLFVVDLLSYFITSINFFLLFYEFTSVIHFIMSFAGMLRAFGLFIE